MKEYQVDITEEHYYQRNSVTKSCLVWTAIWDSMAFLRKNNFTRVDGKHANITTDLNDCTCFMEEYIPVAVEIDISKDFRVQNQKIAQQHSSGNQTKSSCHFKRFLICPILVPNS